MTKENTIYEFIKDKVFFSRFSGAMLEVVKDIPAENDGKSYFNGSTMVDGIRNAEDDIQQVTSITKEGKTVNLEDYYLKNGAFRKGGDEKLLAALGQLMTQEEYRQYQMKGQDKLTFDKTRTIVRKCAPDALSVVIPEGVTAIAKGAFTSCRLLSSVTIPSSVADIGPSAFSYCNFTSITIPDGVTVIPSGCFTYNNSLDYVSLPDSIALIDKKAFYACLKLFSIKLPAHLTEIGEYAFASCAALESICIPDSVTQIGKGAFKSCMELKEVYIKNPELLKDAGLAKNVNIITDPSLISAYRGKIENIAMQGACRQSEKDKHKLHFMRYVLTSDGTLTISGEGALISEEHVDFHDEEGNDDVIKSTVSQFEEIGAGIQRIVIEKGITELGESSLVGLPMKEAVLPEGLEYIGPEAFCSCTNLEAISIPDSVKVIDCCAFYGCTSLREIHLPKEAEIRDDAFYDCPGFPEIN